MPPFNLLHSLSQDVSRWVDEPLRNLALNPQDTTPTTTTLYAVATAKATTAFPVARSAAWIAVAIERVARHVSRFQLPSYIPLLESPKCMLLPMGAPWNPFSCMFLSTSDIPILCAGLVIALLAMFRFCAGRYAATVYKLQPSDLILRSSWFSPEFKSISDRRDAISSMYRHLILSSSPSRTFSSSEPLFHPLLLCLAMATSGIDLELVKAMMTPLPETFGSESETAHDSTNLDYSMDEGSVNSFLLSLLPAHGGSSDAIDMSDMQGLSKSSLMLHRMSIDIPGTSQTLDMYLEDDNDGDSTDEDDFAQVPLLTQSFSSSTLSSSISSSHSSSGGINDLNTSTNFELQSNGHVQFQSKSQDQTQAQTPFISNHTVLFTPSRSFSSTRSRNLAASLSQIRVKEGSVGATVDGDSLNPFAPSFRPKLWWIGAKSQGVPAEGNVEGLVSPQTKSFFTPPSNVNGGYGRGHGRGHGYGYGTRESVPPAPVMMMPAVSEGAYDYGKGVERQDTSLRRRRMGYY